MLIATKIQKKFKCIEEHIYTQITKLQKCKKKEEN